MSTIPQWFVQQWDTAVRTEASQKESRLQAAVNDRGSITGESFTINFLGDDGGLLDANTVRHGDTEWKLQTHQARVVNMSDFYEAVPLDRNDIPKMLRHDHEGDFVCQARLAARNTFEHHPVDWDEHQGRQNINGVLPTYQRIWGKGNPQEDQKQEERQ